MGRDVGLLGQRMDPKIRPKHVLLSESMEALSEPPKELENQPKRSSQQPEVVKSEHQKEQKLSHPTLNSTS